MKHCDWFLLALLSTWDVLSAQRIGFGIEAGVPATESFDDRGFIYRGGFVPATYRYTVGPVFDLQLAGRLGVRCNALYQPFSFREYSIIGTPSSSKTTGSLWQFPAMLRYRLSEGGIRPFVAAGPSFQVTTGITTSVRFIDQPTAVTYHPEPDRRAIAGAAVGGGFDFWWARLHASPELRYTRWGTENFNFTQVKGDHIGTKLNQIQILLAITL